MHYENLPMQYTEIFSAVKIENFIGKLLMLLIFSLKTYIVGTRKNRLNKAILTSTGDSNEYPQCMFSIKNKKTRFTPANLSFSGFLGNT